MGKIKIDTARKIGAIDPRVYSGFIEHMFRCIYGGIFDEHSPLSNEQGFRLDVLTGSQADGRAFPPNEDRTCHNWTSSTKGVAMVGHIDRKGLRDDAASKSWNSSHPSRGPDGGCSQADLRSTGGDGLFYCFAAN